MKIKVGDQVKVIAGQYKDSVGKVLKTFAKDSKVIVSGVNIHKRHTKPNQMNQTGGIFESEAPIHVSNVKKIDAKEAKKDTKKEVKEAKVEKKETKAKTSKKKAS
ncbi:MAG: 50S ribosomal protein L24 [Bacilli bacterium]|nr:50S ribosomal protein L24 [Bacilli bacterium]